MGNLINRFVDGDEYERKMSRPRTRTQPNDTLNTTTPNTPVYNTNQNNQVDYNHAAMSQPMDTHYSGSAASTVVPVSPNDIHAPRRIDKSMDNNTTGYSNPPAVRAI